MIEVTYEFNQKANEEWQLLSGDCTVDRACPVL